MKCANCGNTNESSLWDEDDTIYCSLCHHRTSKDSGEMIQWNVVLSGNARQKSILLLIVMIQPGSSSPEFRGDKDLKKWAIKRQKDNAMKTCHDVYMETEVYRHNNCIIRVYCRF